MAEGGNKVTVIAPCPKCGRKLQQPVRLNCLHSYCKQCLDDLPRTRVNGLPGWDCLVCDTFTGEAGTKPDVLLKTLLAMDEKGQLNEHHTIDEVSFCSVHKMKEVIFCSSHERLICLICQVDHQECQTQTTETALEKVVVELDIYRKNIASKLATADKQIKDILDEKQNIIDMYKNWEEFSDMELECFINHLRETKSALNQQVKTRESQAIEILNETQTKIEKQAERFRIFSDLSRFIMEHTQNVTQLMEIHCGVLRQGKELNTHTIDTKQSTVSVPVNAQSLYETEEFRMKQLIGRSVQYEERSVVIDKFEHFSTIEVSEKWCNRLNMVDQSICVGVPGNDAIQIYKTWAEYQDTYTDVHKPIVVKQAYNGNVLTGGDNGLFVTYNLISEWTNPQKPTEWIQLENGAFSDITTFRNKFTALDYKEYKLVTYEWNGNAHEWRRSSPSFNIARKHRTGWRGDGEETLTVDGQENVIVCSNNILLVYSCSGSFIKTVTLPGKHYSITDLDPKTNWILCNFDTGEMYSASNILALRPYNMLPNLICKRLKEIRDMTYDRDGHLWILHGSNSAFCISKYLAPIQL